MILATCQHTKSHKHGKDRQGNQRYKCVLCNETFSEPTAKPVGNMRIPVKQAAAALALMLEGMSIRSVQRLTGLCRNTLCDLVLVVGDNCQRLLDAKVRGVAAKDVQVDEIWSFVGMKDRTRSRLGKNAECGDSWTFVAIERDTKLVLAHKVGQRDAETCCNLLYKLNDAVAGNFQLTTDGFSSYRSNVPFVLGSRVDFGVLIKNYASTQITTRYSPAKIINSEKKPQFGDPDFDRISTSHVERFNLQMRMSLRRFTRLTNGHSKSLAHHTAMQAIFIAYYNFCRKHETIKQTPAMAASLTDRQWSIKSLLENAATC